MDIGTPSPIRFSEKDSGLTVQGRLHLLVFNLATDADDPILGFATRWIEKLAASVESIHVITMRVGRVDLPANVHVHSVGKERGYSEPRRVVEFYRILGKLLRGREVDVCFSHMIPIFTILAAPVLKFSRVPIVTWYAHPSLPNKLKLAHLLSDKMVTSLNSAYPYRKDKLVVLGQGIDVDIFSPDSLASQDHPPMILCTGRLSPIKGHPTLIEAACLLRDRFKLPFQVVIVGAPSGSTADRYIQSLHDQAEKLRLTELIHFVPAVRLSELPAWHGRSLLHVNLTPLGFGDKVALEAMACGKPSLVANEGFEETLGDYRDRLLFRHGDPQDLAEKLAYWLTLPTEQRVDAGSYLRQRVIHMHGLDSLVIKLLKVLGSTRQKRSFG